MSVNLKELLNGTDYNRLPTSHQNNLMTLLERVNKIQNAYSKPFVVTSGYRSMEHHIEIYKDKAKKAGIPFDESKVPKGSKHLIGAAVDISDPKQELQKWCKDNIAKLEAVDLWLEDFSATTNWVHFQIFPPASGKRFFIP